MGKEKTTNSAIGQMVLAYLSEDQQTALRNKASAAKTDFVKDYTSSDSEDVKRQDDLVFAYIVASMVKEADNAIFSARRQGLIYDLLREYRGFQHTGSPEGSVEGNLLAVTWRAVDRVVETCNSDTGRLKTLAEAVKKDILKGKTAMPELEEKCFTGMCAYMGVDHKSIK